MNLKEIKKETLLNILSAKGIINTHYKLKIGVKTNAKKRYRSMATNIKAK